MKIKLHNLSGGPREFPVAGEPDELGLPVDIFPSPVEVRLRVEETGDLITADFHIHAVTRQVCDRCAIEFEMPLEVQHRMYFIPEGSGRMSDDEEVKYFHPDRPELEIGGDVHDALLLAVPLKILCREECRGLCPHCGADLNLEECSCAVEQIDPKWIKLEKLRNQTAAK